MFVRLTNAIVRKTCMVNINHIQYFTLADPNHPLGHTTIELSQGEGTLKVEEPFEVVKQRIRETLISL